MSQQESTNTVHQDAAENRPELNLESNEAPANASPEDTAATSSQADPGNTALQRQVQEFIGKWQQERADFANYKKRTEREMKDLARNAAVETLMSMLPIIDDLERAMTNIPAELKENPWINGVSAIHRKFQKLLDERGVTLIDPTGQPFDPTHHEAVATEDSSEIESGHVTVTLQKGYALGERVLRPALVRVAN